MTARVSRPPPWRRIASGLIALSLIAACGWPTVTWSALGENQPVVAMPAVGDGDTMAVIYSGDGGWGPLDQSLARSLVKAGIPVVGYNSLRYFASGRTPAGAAGDLSSVLRRQLAAWDKRRVVLIGYSFGADALPAIVPQLPSDLRARVRLLALVGLGPRGDLQWRPTSWINILSDDAWPTAPAVAALRGAPLLCVYGAREHRSACPDLPADLIHRVELPGDHHFGGDYHALSRTILQALPAPVYAGSAGSRSGA